MPNTSKSTVPWYSATVVAFAMGLHSLRAKFLLINIYTFCLESPPKLYFLADASALKCNHGTTFGRTPKAEESVGKVFDGSGKGFVG